MNFFIKYRSINTGFIFRNQLAINKNVFSKYMSLKYILGNFYNNAIVFITTFKRKKIKMKVHKTWKRWRKIRNSTKKNLKKD